MNTDNTLVFYLEANTPIEYNTICQVDIHSADCRRFTLPFGAWSMCLNPDTNEAFALALDGHVCRANLADEVPLFTTKKLQFPNSQYKPFFPTINYVNGFVVVVAYLKTPKEDDSCPNRLFLLTPELEVTGVVDITLSGKIFCKSNVTRFSVPHSQSDGWQPRHASLHDTVQRQGIRRQEPHLFHI